MFRNFLVYSSVLAVLAGFTNVSAETVTTAADQKALSLTIYNSDLALIRDTRTISLPVGEQTLAFKEISSAIQPETAMLKGEKVEVIEQNFEFDLLSPVTLLNKYVGRDVSIVRQNEKTGEEKTLDAKVLSTAGGIVLQIGNNIETEPDGRLIYPDVPANLRERPTLTMLVENESTSVQDLELTYLTGGLSWRADYVALLNADENRIDLKGWVTLTNSSGASYENSKLQLVAGDVNRAEVLRGAMPTAMQDYAAAAPQRAPRRVKQESLFEYHLYTVDRPTTILQNQSKQIALLQENEGICSKELVLKSFNQSYYYAKMGEIEKGTGVEVFLRMTNDKASNLGLPKPAGIVRVYKQDSDGTSQFIGEDNIDHTPENEIIKIKLGRAFDVTADRTQTDFSFLGNVGKAGRINESEFEITLKNAKEEKVVVTVEEIIPGDWEILNESLPHKKENAAVVSWQVSIEPKKTTVLKYRVRTTLR